MTDEDARDLAIHETLENVVQAMMYANGWNRKQALERLVGFCENDCESPVFISRPGKIPKRKPRALCEVSA